MFGKSKPSLQVSVGTIIGEGIEIVAGKISGSGNLRIDGTYEGSIIIDGTVNVGEGGKVKGETRADGALIAGEYNGDVFIKGTIHLTRTSKFTGNVNCNTLVMDEDAIFNGHCTMRTAETPITSAAASMSDNAGDSPASNPSTTTPPRRILPEGFGNEEPDIRRDGRNDRKRN